MRWRRHTGASSDEFVTVASFPHPTDLLFIEAELREREIPFRTLDATTVQTAPFYSAAIGGVRLQVPEGHLPEVIALLKDLGIHEDVPSLDPQWLLWMEHNSQKIPWIRRFSFGRRMLMLFLLFVVVATSCAIVLGIQLRPSPGELLRSQKWCIAAIAHDGKYVEPSTVEGMRLVFSGCPEELTFHSNGTVSFPGIGTRQIYANWDLDGEYLNVSEADTLGELYNGLYAYQVTHSELIMRSRRTTIEASAFAFSFRFPR